MRTSRRGRASRFNDLGQALFGSAGWLFADLMLAIAMAFLVANTVGVHLHKPPRPTPHPTVLHTPPPALELHPVHVNLQIDPQGLLSRSPRAMASVRNQVLRVQGLASRRAGLVLLFGGDSQGEALAYSLDRRVSAVLSDLGRRNFVFQKTVYRDFLEVGGPPTVVQLDIYLFKSQPVAP